MRVSHSERGSCAKPEPVIIISQGGRSAKHDRMEHAVNNIWFVSDLMVQIRIQKVYLLGHRPVQNFTKYNSFKSTILRVIIIIRYSIVPCV